MGRVGVVITVDILSAAGNACEGFIFYQLRLDRRKQQTVNNVIRQHVLYKEERVTGGPPQTNGSHFGNELTVCDRTAASACE